MIEPFAKNSVRGFLHHPERPSGNGIALAHGAGSNCQAPLLVSVAKAFAEAGFIVLRCDLPFRQARPGGPPSPAGAAADREGLRAAADVLRAIATGRVFLGGHSYGGRQASMLAADDPAVAQGLLLLSYPLHPPNRPEQMRTAHFPKLAVPSVFVHGARDPFGTLDEVRGALALITAPTSLVEIERAWPRSKIRPDAAAGVERVFWHLWARRTFPLNLVWDIMHASAKYGEGSDLADLVSGAGRGFSARADSSGGRAGRGGQRHPASLRVDVSIRRGALHAAPWGTL